MPLAGSRLKLLSAYAVFFASALLFTFGVGLLLAAVGVVGEVALLSLVLLSLGATAMIVSAYYLVPRPVLVLNKDDMFRLLGKSEREVLEILAERKELSHKEIVELTGFSPAKVSRITKKLEKMGLISQVRQERKKVAVIKPEVRRIILSG